MGTPAAGRDASNYNASTRQRIKRRHGQVAMGSVYPVSSTRAADVELFQDALGEGETFALSAASEKIIPLLRGSGGQVCVHRRNQARKRKRVEKVLSRLWQWRVGIREFEGCR